MNLRIDTAYAYEKLQPLSNAKPSGMSELYPEWWGEAPTLKPMIECKGSPKCVNCHADNARMDSLHAIACDNCHGGDIESGDKDKAHSGLITRPGELDTVDRTCGKCHAEVSKKVKMSAMALSPRMINQTLYAFGVKECSQPVFGTVNTEHVRIVPDPSEYFENTTSSSAQSSVQSLELKQDKPELFRNLGADLLRRSCLRCHLNTRGSSRPGESRGAGCSACHVAYSNRADKKPTFHAIIRNVGVTACLKCHNSNHVGGDFVGLFEKDHNRGFRSPIVSGHQAPTIYGSEQHRLSSDSHFKASMTCVDCHTIGEIHGSGKPGSRFKKNVEISCSGCHVSGNHPSVVKDTSDNFMLTTRDASRRIPKWNPGTVSHKIRAHRENLNCSSCHAAWSFQDYGLHLMLDERNEYWKWSINSSQNDPQVQDLLRRYTGDFAQLIPPEGGRLPNLPEEAWQNPESFDWLSNTSRIGVWFRAWTLRRWSNPSLGLDSNGKVSILRPMNQYVISFVDIDDQTIIDSRIPTTGSGLPALIVNPYTPHTTTRVGRSCQDCHGSFKAAGLGEALKGIQDQKISPIIRIEEQVSDRVFRWDAFVDQNGNPTQFSLYDKPAGPLPSGIMKRLLNPSSRHRIEWFEQLWN